MSFCYTRKNLCFRWMWDRSGEQRYVLFYPYVPPELSLLVDVIGERWIMTTVTTRKVGPKKLCTSSWFLGNKLYPIYRCRKKSQISEDNILENNYSHCKFFTTLHAKIGTALCCKVKCSGTCCQYWQAVTNVSEVCVPSLNSEILYCLNLRPERLDYVEAPLWGPQIMQDIFYS
jgi:hypothetical protein